MVPMFAFLEKFTSCAEYYAHLMVRVFLGLVIPKYIISKRSLKNPP